MFLFISVIYLTAILKISREATTLEYNWGAYTPPPVPHPPQDPEQQSLKWCYARLLVLIKSCNYITSNIVTL